MRESMIFPTQTELVNFQFDAENSLPTVFSLFVNGPVCLTSLKVPRLFAKSRYEKSIHSSGSFEFFFRHKNCVTTISKAFREFSSSDTKGIIFGFHQGIIHIRSRRFISREIFAIGPLTIKKYFL